MSANTLTDYANAHATTPGVPKDESVLGLKLLWIIARKLDRDAGVTDTNYEALILAQNQSVDPIALVP